jgi:tetratricopeptide (TPR) repeat protein
VRRADRRIARLLRQGTALDLARAYAARVDALIESEEHEEAFAQLEELIALLGRIEEPTAPRLLAAALARRVRLAFGHDERRPGALADVERGLVAVARSSASPEVSELEVELLIHRGRLLNLAGEPDAARVPLERAIALADGLTPRARRLFLVRARRELGVALAQSDVDLGLAALDIAEGHLDEGDVNDPLPEAEGQLLASTRAEVLANAGRFDEALAVLAGRPIEEDWPLLQRAATLEMADRDEEAREVGVRLIDRLQEQLDGRDPGACHELAEALLAQARRVIL